MTTIQEKAAARHIPRETGKTYHILGETVIAKGAVAGSSQRIAVVTVPPGAGVPVHHHPSPETFVMIEGEIVFTLGDGDALGEARGRPGDIVTAPSGVWHAYRNESGALARFAIVFDQSLEDFFAAASTPSASAGPPTPAMVERAVATAQAHGMQIRM